MPFDALVPVRQRNAIADILEHHGLRPVPWEKLILHKAEQQGRHGPSFWFRHQTALSIGLVVASPVAGAIAGATGGLNAHSGVMAITGSFVWMCMVALITGTGLIRLRGPSHWEERALTADDDVPEPIARVARAVRADLPRARLVLGELKREESVLDPYLLIEYRDESVCLGIWEDDVIVACAR